MLNNNPAVNCLNEFSILDRYIFTLSVMRIFSIWDFSFQESDLTKDGRLSFQADEQAMSP